jgi:FkbM family methyltransferase
MNRRDFDVDLDGGKLACARFETATGRPPLLLVPGTFGHIGGLLPLVAELATRFSVLVFDQPGTGASTPSPLATPERLATALGKLCESEFAGVPATICGVSLGAVVAALIARTRLSRVRALIFDDPVFSPGDYPGISDYAAELGGRLTTDQRIMDSFAAFTGRDPRTGTHDGRDYRHLWQDIVSPLLVLAGEGFHTGFEADARASPGLSEIERRSGHPTWMLDPQRFASRAAAFAAEAPAPSPQELVRDDEYALRLTGGVVAICRRAATSTSTLILMEKETWFEDEFAFVRSLVRPGWRAVDGGANLGVYALTLAHAGAEVLAFEPNPPIADRASRAIALNGLSDRVRLRQVALGAVPGTARFDVAIQPENARLAADGAIEVPVVTLDAELAATGWPAWDFLKLDLEGGEADALRGGALSLARHAPLVMTEIVHADTTPNRAPLRELLRQGFAIYTLLSGANALVPFDPDEPDPDPFLAYGFAATPARARALAAEAKLVETVPPAETLGDASTFLALASSRIAILTGNPGFARHLSTPREPFAREYAEAIARFERARIVARPLPMRVSDLLAALRLAKAAYDARPGIARAMTYARIARAAGRRHAMIDTLGRTLDAILTGNPLVPDEPLLPAVERFESVATGNFGDWLNACLIEGFVHNASFAAGLNVNAFSGVFWDFLESSGLGTPATQRARQIQAMIVGALDRPIPHPALARFGPDNLNPEIWRGL